MPAQPLRISAITVLVFIGILFILAVIGLFIGDTAPGNSISNALTEEVESLPTPEPTHTLSPEDKAAQTRWQEQWEHWANIDAFNAGVEEVRADRVISKEESKHICFTLEQRESQMEAAKTYVQEYSQTDPVRATLPSIYKIEEEADNILELLNQVECQ